MTQEALKLALEHGSFPQGSGVIRAIKEALAQLEQECPNLKNCNGACFQCEYFNVETGEMEYPVAQLEQEHDNSAVHLAHCYQGEYPVCKYGDENCPATPKVKTQPEQEQEPVACAECERLKDALKRANGLAEHFERAWYLRGDEIEQLNAEPEQEPVAWRVWSPDGDKQYLYSENGDGEPLYTHSQRTWVGLTDEELHQICNSLDYYGDRGLVQLIEAKLKEKNNG